MKWKAFFLTINYARIKKIQKRKTLTRKFQTSRFAHSRQDWLCTSSSWSRRRRFSESPAPFWFGKKSPLRYRRPTWRGSGLFSVRVRWRSRKPGWTSSCTSWSASWCLFPDTEKWSCRSVSSRSRTLLVSQCSVLLARGWCILRIQSAENKAIYNAILSIRLFGSTLQDMVFMSVFLAWKRKQWVALLVTLLRFGLIV